MGETIIIQGITLDDFLNKIKETVRAEIAVNEEKRVTVLSKSEAGRQLGINYRTLQKVMDEMKLTELYPSDLDRILAKYPKYVRKAKPSLQRVAT